MHEHGHTSVPSASNPNAHEYSASAAPPTIGSTFDSLGEDLGEQAQTMLNFIIAVVTSLSFQCQMCTHQTATTAHERVMVFGENLCSEVHLDHSDDGELPLGPLPSEAASGYGPMRSRVG